MARVIGVLMLYEDGTLAVRQERWVSRSKWAGDTDEWAGGAYSPREVLLLAVVAQAAADAAATDEQDEDDEPVALTETAHERAVALGREGGKKGGIARAAALSPERRSEIARKAARTRWETTHARTLPYPEASA